MAGSILKKTIKYSRFTLDPRSRITEEERKESRQESKHSFDSEIKYYIGRNIKLRIIEC